MNKKTKITSLTTAALATMLLAGVNLTGNVKADTVKDTNANSTQKAQSPKEVAQGNIKSAQKEVDAAQTKVTEASKSLSTAKKDAQAPDKDYADQDKQVKNSETNLTNKKNAATAAQNKVNDAQKLVDQATDANITAAKKAVEDKKAEISNKQTDLKNTQDQEPAKQAAINKANNDVKNAQSNLNSKNAAKANADTAVKNAQDALKDSEVDKAIKEAAAAKQKVAQDNTDLTNVKNDIEDKIAKKQQAATAKTKADNAKATAQKSQTTALNDYNSKKSIVDKVNKDITTKTNEISKLEKTLADLQEKSKNNITIPDIDKFKQAYKDYQTTGNLTDADITYVTDAASKNSFVSSDADKNVTVDINNLTDDQLEEISLFTSDLLTKLRKQLGWSADEVSKGSLELAKDIAKKYIADDWKGSWHDGNAVNDAADENGLRSNHDSDRSTGQYYENKSDSWGIVTTPTISMDELKENIYNSILTMIFPDGNGEETPDGPKVYEMGHTAGLLGASFFADELEPENNLKPTAEEILKYANERTKGVWQDVIINGVDYDYDRDSDDDTDLISYRIYDGVNDDFVTKDEFVKRLEAAIPTIFEGQYVAVIPTFISDAGMPFSIHFIGVNPDHIEDNSKFSTQIISSYATQIDKTKESLNNANSDLEKLKSELPAKQNAMNQAKTTLDGFTAQFEAAKNTAKRADSDDQAATTALQNATTKKAELQETLKKDTADSEAKQKKVDEFTKSKDSKLQTLKTALVNQTKAESDVEAAKTQLKNAKKSLDDANKAKSDLEQSIKDKQAAIEKAQSGLNDLTVKRDALINAPQTLKTAQNNLKSAKEAVTAAKEALKADQDKLKDLQKPKDEADAKVEEAQAAYDAADKELTDAKTKLTKAQDVLDEIERQEQEAAELAAQQAQAQAEAAKKAAELKKAADEAKPVTLTHNAYVYDKDGNAIQVNGQNKKLYKGDAINAYSNAKIVTIKGKEFYQIGENEFVKVANTIARKAKKTVVPKSVKLTHNAFVYDKNGKRVKLTWIKRGSTIKPTKLVTIKGKKYYQVGKNKFIKVANTKAKTHVIKKAATIKAKLNHKVATYNRSGKKNGHHVLGMRTYKFNEKRVINGKTYYKISGKNDWLPASKLNLKK